MRHKIVVGAMVALLTSVMAASVMAQAAPQAIQGSVTSVGDNKASFGVTVKNTEVKVPVTPATRYALDDTASDFATAVVVGRDVNVIMTGDGNAYIVMATSVPAKGTVKSAAAGSIVVTTKKGADVTIKVGPDTKYVLDKAPSTFEAATAAGNTVTANVGAGGVATDVTAKSANAAKAPKPPKTPATPGTPATPPAAGN